MVDLVGLEMTAAIETLLVQKFSERSYKSRLLQVMEEDNREGKLVSIIDKILSGLVPGITGIKKHVIVFCIW